MFLLPIMSIILHHHDSFAAPSRLLLCTVKTIVMLLFCISTT